VADQLANCYFNYVFWSLEHTIYAHTTEQHNLVFKVAHNSSAILQIIMAVCLQLDTFQADVLSSLSKVSLSYMGFWTRNSDQNPCI